MRNSRGEGMKGVRKRDMPSAAPRYQHENSERNLPTAVMVLACHTFSGDGLLERDTWWSWETSWVPYSRLRWTVMSTTWKMSRCRHTSMPGHIVFHIETSHRPSQKAAMCGPSQFHQSTKWRYGDCAVWVDIRRARSCNR